MELRKPGFYYFSIMGWYTLIYLFSKVDDEYPTFSVLSIKDGKVTIETEKKASYIKSNSHTLNRYRRVKFAPWEEWKKVSIEFLFEFYGKESEG